MMSEIASKQAFLTHTHHGTESRQSLTTERSDFFYPTETPRQYNITHLAAEFADGRVCRLDLPQIGTGIASAKTMPKYCHANIMPKLGQLNLFICYARIMPITSLDRVNLIIIISHKLPKFNEEKTAGKIYLLIANTISDILRQSFFD